MIRINVEALCTLQRRFAVFSYATEGDVYPPEKGGEARDEPQGASDHLPATRLCKKMRFFGHYCLSRGLTECILKCSTNPPQEAGTFPEVIFEIAKQSPDVERITMGRFNAFLPVQPGMRLPGALDVQACESIVSLRSLQARAAALIEEKA